ncbi:MAG: YHYH protein [Proteobacteria bacterium]|nr:YHYH protein [Pseudomonadota bacterium]
MSFTTPTVSVNETLVFEVKGTLGNEEATDTIRVEIWVPPSDTNDLTALGDFSAKSGWACNQDPVSTPELTTSQGSDYMRYQSNGIANHATGTFPNQGNPNTIQQVSHSRDIPTNPVKTNQATDMVDFGVTLDGVKLERDTAEFYSSARQWNYEALTPAMAQRLTASSAFDWLGSDCNNAHVQPTGAYHYHGLPESLINRLGETSPQTTMILGGYAADGFPIYLRYGFNQANDSSSGVKVIASSWQVKNGTRPSSPSGRYDGTFREDWEYVAGSGDLDQCNGLEGVTPEYPEGTYHYYITDDYPYIPRCVMGTPDASFRMR